MTPVFAAVLLYNGLLYPEMGTIANAMAARHQPTETLWHDQQPYQTSCPRLLSGHSMGGNAALAQAARCAAAGKPPRVVVTIDPGRAPLFHTCPAHVTCINYYDPSHAIGGQRISGAKNVVVSGYTHLQLPSVPAVVAAALAALK